MTAPTVGTRLVVGGAVSLVALVLMAAPAAAHTELTSSSPAAGATVTELTRIDLRFTEPIEVAASHVWVTDVAGSLELAGLTSIDGDSRSLTVPVPPWARGTYEVTWHVLAADGDPVQGSFTVTVAPASAAVTPRSARPGRRLPAGHVARHPPRVGRAAWGRRRRRGDHGHGPGDLTKGLARGVLDTSLAVLVGGLGFIALVWPKGAALAPDPPGAVGRRRHRRHRVARAHRVPARRRHRHEHLRGARPLAAARGARLPLRSRGRGAGRADRRRRSCSSPPLVRASNRPVPSRTWVAVAIGLAVALSETMVLLGQSVSMASLLGLARLTHVIGISAWIGGLVMLLAVALPRRRTAELLALLPRFSSLRHHRRRHPRGRRRAPHLGPPRRGRRPHRHVLRPGAARQARRRRPRADGRRACAGPTSATASVRPPASTAPPSPGRS